jgi:hypothetical protein
MHAQNQRRGGECSQREGGQVLVVFALFLTSLLAICALAVDIGLAYREGSKMQAAADAAALAGAGALPVGIDAATVEALTYAESNGYVDGQDGFNITVTTPYNGETDKIEVLIDGPTPAKFAKVLGISFFSQSHRAVATYYGHTQLNAALLSLDQTSCSAYDQSGSSIVTVNGGGIMVNSSCNPSMTQGGSGGTYGDVLQYFSPGGSSGTFSPPPKPVNAKMPDPLAGLDPPDFDPLTCVSYTDITQPCQSPDSGGTPEAPASRSVSGNATLKPGVYYGGLKITGSGNVTFEAGTYVMAGGGLEVGSSANTSNTVNENGGVLIYNTSDPSHPTQAGACASISLVGGGDTAFTPYTSGPYKDVVYWQDPACTADFKVAGGGTMASGVYYLPGADFNVSGGKTLGSAQIVASTFSFSGNAPFTVTAGNYVDLPLISAPRLVE